MKQAMSLEEEKQRLLEQLENSRAFYRRMLTDADEPLHDEVPPTAYGYAPPAQRGRFPQSQTMRWAMEHPYLVAAGAAVLIMTARKGWSKTRRKAEPVQEEQNAGIKKGIAATTLGTTLATTAAMMLRNPAQMQAAMRALTLAVNYYKSRRGNARPRFE